MSSSTESIQAGGGDAGRPASLGQSPLVSVIIPVFNRPRRIENAIESVVAQTYRPIELLVVDDGSSDDTPNVLEEMKTRIGDLPGFQLKIIRQENAGAPAARNHGFRRATGEWIQFLDSDDQLLPDKLSNAISLAQRTRADVVYSKAQYVDEDGYRLPRFWGKPLAGDWRDCYEFSWQTMCALYSRKALEKIGPWNEELVISQDWEFCIRAVISGLDIRFEDRVDALYLCEGDDRIGASPTERKNRGREIALWTVHKHLCDKNRMNAMLRQRFRTRLLHVALCYRADDDAAAARALVDRMEKEGLLGKAAHCFFRIGPPKVIAGKMLEVFRRHVESRKASFS